ncbi:DM13 domain-containing protein [Pelagibius litoralis]|uniref:DM13 domain-containing protein n=1 Tax=Pelagibius litoralis TaxID=374515 RepID=A0A967K8X5_9PROT|nr:DM13 domain-containing protein [Pelagibius litoralis]NIA69522.1 DM13 domain-containing protein [Pelagibius litoralis]
MKKLILVAFIAGAVGFVAGNAFWYLASPLWIDQVVAESIGESETAMVLASGTFSDADTAHKGRGTVTVFQGQDGRRTLRFTDFEVTNGPDLKVWLVAADTVAQSSDVSNSAWLALGRLKGNIGDQNYDIPAEADLSKYKSVVIWCERFGVLFSPASLTP